MQALEEAWDMEMSIPLLKHPQTNRASGREAAIVTKEVQIELCPVMLIILSCQDCSIAAGVHIRAGSAETAGSTFQKWASPGAGSHDAGSDNSSRWIIL